MRSLDVKRVLTGILKTCRDGELKGYGLAISEVVDSLTGGDFCAGRACGFASVVR